MTLKQIEVRKKGDICTVALDGMLQTYLSPIECKKALESAGYEPQFIEEKVDAQPAIVPPVDPAEVERKILGEKGESRTAPPPKKRGGPVPPSSSGKSIADFKQVLLTARQYANKKNQRILDYKLEAISELLQFLGDDADASR